MVVDTFQGIFYAVCQTVNDEQASVIHLHPHVLGLINDKRPNTVVQSLDTTSTTCLVVVEVKTIKAGYAVPRCYPHIAIVVIVDT